MKPQPDEIAKLAYRLYLEDGKAVGCAEDHWQRAEEFLSHPENHSDQNVLSVPSEPEITRALDEKARILDLDLPSDPHSGAGAVHQRVDLALDSRKEPRNKKALAKALKHLPGIERVETDVKSSRVSIYFDARRTNPAAIHEAIFDGAREEIDLPAE